MRKDEDVTELSVVPAITSTLLSFIQLEILMNIHSSDALNLNWMYVPGPSTGDEAGTGGKMMQTYGHHILINTSCSYDSNK
jgi:hypothetical protein